MPEWRLIDLDPAGGEPPQPRAVGPFALAMLLVVALAVVSLLPQALTRPIAPGVPEPTASPASRPTTASTAFMLTASRHDPLACPVLDAATPALTFLGEPIAIRRIDTEITFAADPDWTWCVAGARLYQDGIEVVGMLASSAPQAAGLARPVLRDATFAADLAPFRDVGPSELLDVDGYAVLHLRTTLDGANRGSIAHAFDGSNVLRLRVGRVAGPWSFAPVALREAPLTASAEAHEVRFELHDLKVLSDSVATTLYARSDVPDPAIVSFEWDAVDDVGTVYRPLPDRRIDGTPASTAPSRRHRRVPRRRSLSRFVASSSRHWTSFRSRFRCGSAIIRGVKTWRIEDLDSPETAPARIVDPMEWIGLVLIGVLFLMLGVAALADRSGGDATPIAERSAPAPTPSPLGPTLLVHSTGMASAGLWCEAISLGPQVSDTAPPRRVITIVTTAPNGQDVASVPCVIATPVPAR